MYVGRGDALPVHRLVPRRAAGHTRHTDTLVQAVDLVRERLRRDMGIREILADLFEQCLSPHPSANEVASPTPPPPPSISGPAEQGIGSKHCLLAALVPTSSTEVHAQRQVEVCRGAVHAWAQKKSAQCLVAIRVSARQWLWLERYSRVMRMEARRWHLAPPPPPRWGWTHRGAGDGWRHRYGYVRLSLAGRGWAATT